MAWLWFVDTSHHTDYMLILAIDCFVAAMTLYTAIVAGLGLAAAGLTILFVALIGATWYARFLWKQEETESTPRKPGAFKIRPSR